VVCVQSLEIIEFRAPDLLPWIVFQVELADREARGSLASMLHRIGVFRMHILERSRDMQCDSI